MIIIFAWTTPALVAGAKTVTRRQWKDSHVAKFEGGMLVDAYDRSPRHGGKPVAVIRIVLDPYEEPISEMLDVDYYHEGFHYMNRHPWLIPKSSPFKTASWEEFLEWKAQGGLYWVVRLELVKVIER